MEKEVLLPKISDNINTVTITEIMVSIGDKVNVEDSLLTIESEKASLEVPSEFEGFVKKILVKVGDDVKIGTVIIIIETESGGISTVEENKSTKVLTASTETAPLVIETQKENLTPNVFDEKTKIGSIDLGDTTDKNIPVSPLARKIAREMGVNLQELAKVTPTARITVDDVKHYAVAAKENYSLPITSEQIPIPDFSQWGNVRIENLSSIRKITAKNTTFSWQTMPHVTHFDQSDITEIEAFRQKYNSKNKSTVTITTILLKMMGIALRQFPKFNSSLDIANNQLIFKEFYHIGVAADTKDGLLMPVIQNVDKKGILEMSNELSQMAERARNRKLLPDEMQGQTFVISNLGGIGGIGFTPIVFPNNCAILGVSRGSIQPIFDKDKNNFVPRLMLPLSLSYDHRVIDGAEAARFMRWICEGLEQPVQMLF